MILTSDNIYSHDKNKLLDKKTASDLLIQLFENYELEDLRLNCIDILNRMGIRYINIFKFLEYILISDKSNSIRNAEFDIIKKDFKIKGIQPIKFLILNETNLLTIKLIEFLYKADKISCREILKEKIRQIQDIDIEFSKTNPKLEKINTKSLKVLLFNYILRKSLETLYQSL